MLLLSFLIIFIYFNFYNAFDFLDSSPASHRSDRFQLRKGREHLLDPCLIETDRNLIVFSAILDLHHISLTELYVADTVAFLIIQGT